MALSCILPFSVQLTGSQGCRLHPSIISCAKPSKSGREPRKQQPQQRQIRRRRLKQEDPQSKVHASEHYWEPYLERHIRRVREQGININDDVEKLKLRTENKFELILDLAETANEFLVNHPEESIRKKPGLKVISDAINQTGTVEVEDAYPDATFEFLEELGMF
ncbi:hypothetical protein KP509_38G050000 [Ceratopteris richardii]|uniref:Uncharacterized protein n=1 Tax=Ceratopteris richardii TaxID=49495 RepID=A0A8T2Q4E6_CERRI|nr:hypothetical protein KP509_38G050000 [Ceratopteris richardii]